MDLLDGLLDAFLAADALARLFPKSKKLAAAREAQRRRREERLRREGHPPTGFWGLDEDEDDSV